MHIQARLSVGARFPEITLELTEWQPGKYPAMLPACHGGLQIAREGVRIKATPDYQAPTTSFTDKRTLLNLGFNCSDSSDPDGSIVSWQWDSVTDDRGATGNVSCLGKIQTIS